MPALTFGIYHDYINSAVLRKSKGDYIQMASKAQLSLMTSILGMSEFKVIGYQNIEGIGIFLKIEKKEKKVMCPCCGKTTDKVHENHWYRVKDLPWGEQDVYLEVNRRQMRCPHCGKKFSEELGIIQKKRGYSLRLREKIVEEVLSSDIKNTAKRNDVSEQEIETMLKDLGEELKSEKPKELKKLGIDEIAIVKGQKNYYVVLVDVEKKKLIGMIEKRNKEEIESYLKSWGEEVLRGVEEVSIDLWKAYKNVAESLMPQAEIVADRFHVMKQVNEELDKKRRRIKREAKKEKDVKKKEKKLETLKHSKYALLKNESELKEVQKEKIESIRKELPELGEMHRLKEEFRKVFEESNNWGEGLLRLGDWLKESSDLCPSSCCTIRRWIGEIIAYFDQGTTQGVVEGINNKLKLIKRRGYGFRNFDNFKLRTFLTWHFST